VFFCLALAFATITVRFSNNRNKLMIDAQTFAAAWKEQFLTPKQAAQLPPDACDWSWHNDACPSIAITKDNDEGPHVRLWIAEADPEDREYPDAPRYCVETYIDSDTPIHDDVQTDSWSEALEHFENRVIYMRNHLDGVLSEYKSHV
jgi:hypothetical protein